MVKYFYRPSRATKIKLTKNFQLLIITTTKFYSLKKKQCRTRVLACQPNIGVGNRMSMSIRKFLKASLSDRYQQKFLHRQLLSQIGRWRRSSARQRLVARSVASTYIKTRIQHIHSSSSISNSLTILVLDCASHIRTYMVQTRTVVKIFSQPIHPTKFSFFNRKIFRTNFI